MRHFVLDMVLISVILAVTAVPVSAQQQTDSVSVGNVLKAKVDSLKLSLAGPVAQAAADSSANVLPPAPEDLASAADSLHRNYEFAGALDLYEQALAATADSSAAVAINDAMILSQNGLSMMNYCSRPSVVTKKRFSIKDFYLYYPLEDGAWRDAPNVLDSLMTEPFVNSTYIPDSTKTIYYSAADAEGIRNIYSTHLLDGEWSVPELINEQMTSSSDEIFPSLSPDGRSLYFASRGLYGMGGYDIYVSTWDREARDWGMPVNMGFPYSSPYDDFLFVNSPDGRYSFFASNRECSRDSVYVYVLEYDSMPVRQAVSSAEELRSIAALVPQVTENTAVPVEEPSGSADMGLYMEKMASVRSLRDSVAAFNSEMDAMRAVLVTLPAEEQSAQIAAILAKETALPALQARLDSEVKELQKIEMDFLVSGVVIDPDKLGEDVAPEKPEESSKFSFVKLAPGLPLNLKVKVPVPVFDYTFRILPQAQLAENPSLPSGLVYQIQFATASKKLPLAEMKGLSPVFEVLKTSLKFVYSVGLFTSYSDVLSHLNSVKKLGFKSAFITAYRDGKPIDVAAARAMEKKIRPMYQISIWPESGSSLPELAITAIRQQTDAEIVRRDEGGRVVYQVGPLDDRQKAEAILTTLRATGVTHANVQELGQMVVDK